MIDLIFDMKRNDIDPYDQCSNSPGNDDKQNGKEDRMIADT